MPKVIMEQKSMLQSRWQPKFYKFSLAILHGIISDSKEPDSLREKKGEYKHFVYVNYNCLRAFPFLELLNDFALHHMAAVCYLFSARYSRHLDVLTLWRAGLSLQSILAKASRVLSLMYLLHALLVWAFRNYKKLWNWANVSELFA